MAISRSRTRGSWTTATCSVGGVTSGLDLALHLVERECGADVAGRVVEEIEYERRNDPAET